VDYNISSSVLYEINEPSIKLKFIKNDESTQNIDCSLDKFRVLYSELKKARKLMEEYSN
jgi:hypothetical protein